MSNSVGKLLLSSVSAATLCLSLASSAGAADRDGEIFARFFPWFEFGGVVGTDNSSRGEATFFVPLTQTHDSLFFTEWRGKLFEQDVQEVNAAFGYRRMLNNGYNLGVWIGADYRDTSSNNTFWQLSGGIEALSERYDFRANWYAPITSAQGAAGNGNVVFQAGNIFLVNGQEVPLYGADVEAGIRFALDQAMFAQTDAVLGVYAGGFYFDASDANQSVAGPRARFELSFENIAATMPGSKFTAEYEYSYDDVRKSKHEFGVRLRLPLGKVEEDRGPDAGQWRRMMAGLERDTDIVTDVVEAGLELTSDYHTGVDYLRAVVVNDNAGLVDALALGDGTLIIADGVNGAFEGGIEVGARQTLLGGMGDLRVVGVDTNRQATFNAPGAHPTFLGGIIKVSQDGNFGPTSVGIVLNDKSKFQDVSVEGEEFILAGGDPVGDDFGDIQVAAVGDEPVPGSYQYTVGTGIMAIGDGAVAIDVDVDHINGVADATGIDWYGGDGLLKFAEVGTVMGFESSTGVRWNGDDGILMGLGVQNVETFALAESDTYSAVGLAWHGARGRALDLAIENVSHQIPVVSGQDSVDVGMSSASYIARGVQWTGDNGTLSNAFIDNVEMATQASGVYWTGADGELNAVAINRVQSADFAGVDYLPTPPGPDGGDGDQLPAVADDEVELEVGTGAFGVAWLGSNGHAHDFTIGSVQSGSLEYGETLAIGVGWFGEGGTIQNSILGPIASGNTDFGSSNAGGFFWLGNDGSLSGSEIVGGVSSGNSAFSTESLSTGLFWQGQNATVSDVSLGDITAGNALNMDVAAVGAQFAGDNANVGELNIGHVTSGDASGEAEIAETSASGIGVIGSNSFLGNVSVGSVRSGNGLTGVVQSFATGLLVGDSEGGEASNSVTVDGLAVESVAAGNGHMGVLVPTDGGGDNFANQAGLDSIVPEIDSTDIVPDLTGEALISAVGINVGIVGTTIRNVTVGSVTGGDVIGEVDGAETWTHGLYVGGDATDANVLNVTIGDVTGGMLALAPVAGNTSIGSVSAVEWRGNAGIASQITAGNIQSFAERSRVYGSSWHGQGGDITQISVGDVTANNVMLDSRAIGAYIPGGANNARGVSFGNVIVNDEAGTTGAALAVGVLLSGSSSALADVSGGNVTAVEGRVSGIATSSASGTISNVSLGNVTNSPTGSGTEAAGINLQGSTVSIDAVQIGDITGGDDTFGLDIFGPPGGSSISNASIGNVTGHAVGLSGEVLNVTSTGLTFDGVTGDACKNNAADTTGTSIVFSIGGGALQTCP